ncbi:hypothetical protein MJT46_010434 [Ovis ammon polii x Ovis aries]|nr:hypothetical protein MJT46_010434 [Ovis ammon polii x Ovis aries]
MPQLCACAPCGLGSQQEKPRQQEARGPQPEGDPCSPQPERRPCSNENPAQPKPMLLNDCSINFSKCPEKGEIVRAERGLSAPQQQLVGPLEKAKPQVSKAVILFRRNQWGKERLFLGTKLDFDSNNFVNSNTLFNPYTSKVKRG